MNIIVTISGPPGSGKTTVAKAVAKAFDLRNVSAGQFFREMARERNMGLQELSALAEKDFEIDQAIDKKQVEEAKKADCVVEGRLSGWFLKDSAILKVWLAASPKTRAQRVAEREGREVSDVLIEVKEREQSEIYRYREIYGIDIGDIGMYDLVINTDLWNADQVIQMIKVALKPLIQE